MARKQKGNGQKKKIICQRSSGDDVSVFVAKINPDGMLTDWKPLTNPSPERETE